MTILPDNRRTVVLKKLPYTTEINVLLRNNTDHILIFTNYRKSETTQRKDTLTCLSVFGLSDYLTVRLSDYIFDWLSVSLLANCLAVCLRHFVQKSELFSKLKAEKIDQSWTILNYNANRIRTGFCILYARLSVEKFDFYI